MSQPELLSGGEMWRLLPSTVLLLAEDSPGLGRLDSKVACTRLAAARLHSDWVGFPEAPAMLVAVEGPNLSPGVLDNFLKASVIRLW